jgi:hypothetical protein
VEEKVNAVFKWKSPGELRNRRKEKLCPFSPGDTVLCRY